MRSDGFEKRLRLKCHHVPLPRNLSPRQAVFYALDKVNGYRRLFSITDTSLRHPYAEHERIPVYALALISGIFPLLVVLIWAGAGRKSWFDAQVGALGLGLTLGLTSTFTNIVKVRS